MCKVSLFEKQKYIKKKFSDAYSLEEGMNQDYIPYILIKVHSTINFRSVWFHTCRILKLVYSENACQMIKSRNTEKTLPRNNDFPVCITNFYA